MAPILVGDVVGYSAMMEADEEGTAARMAEVATIVQEKVKARRWTPLQDDGRCGPGRLCQSVERLALRGRDSDRAGGNIWRRQANAFGLHLADVIEAGEDLIGDGVNLAARIQSSADPGAIDISGTLFEQVRR